MTPYHPNRVATVVTVAAVVGLAGQFNIGRAAGLEEAADILIRQIVAHTTRLGVGVRSTRELRAGTVSGKHEGWMEVETVVSPSGAFSWKVVDEGGSERTRNKVLRELLQAEAESWRAGVREQAALTPANYEFLPLDSLRSGERQLRLKPRRADTRLIDGVLTVTSDGCPIVLEGKLAKSPSFWVKSVTVMKRFHRFAGIALPVTIESIADLRMFGQSSLRMGYLYSEVNGRTVSHTVAALPSFGPSAEIMALHSGAARDQ